MILWMLKPHMPWERFRYLFLAALFMVPSLSLAGFGLALLQPQNTFDYSPSFDAMRWLCPSEDVWGGVMVAMALVQVLAMMIYVRRAWVLLIPHIFIFTTIGVSMAMGYGRSSPGMWLCGSAATDSMLTLICWRFLIER